MLGALLWSHRKALFLRQPLGLATAATAATAATIATVAISATTAAATAASTAASLATLLLEQLLLLARRNF